MASAPDPAVVVLAVPYLYATVVAAELTALDVGPLIVPNLDDGDWQPSERHRAVVASVPVPTSWADIVVQLPMSFLDPVAVTVGDLTVSLRVSSEGPLRDVVALLARLLRADAPTILEELFRTTPPT